MRLLFVTPNSPYPPRTGSTLVAYHHIGQLAIAHSVDLVTYRTRGTDDLGELLAWCREVELIERLPRWRLLANRLQGAARGLPLQVAHTYSPAMATAIARRLQAHTYDVAIFHLPEMAQFLPHGYAGHTLWMMEDPPVLKASRLAEGRSWHHRLRVKESMARIRRYEQAWCARFDRVTLLNRRDAFDYEPYLLGTTLDWVPYGVDVAPELSTDADIRTPGMIIISGNMFHPPNVKAVDMFCRTVLPRVREQVPDATLWLVGARPAAPVRRWAREPGIHVTGAVPSVQDYLRRAMVSVCTVGLPIGTQTKVLEALACGTPVVTTSAGNHGVEGVPGEHLYVADDPQRIAGHVISLLRGERWTALSRQGHAFVRDRFAWPRSTAKLEQILLGVAGAPGGRDTGDVIAE